MRDQAFRFSGVRARPGLTGEATADVPKPDELTDLIVAQVSDAILVWNNEGKVVADNPAAQRLIGSDMIGRKVADVEKVLAKACGIAGRRLPEEWPLALALKGRTVTNQQVRLIDEEDGAAYVLAISATPLRGTDGKMLGGVVILSRKAAVPEHKYLEENASIGASTWETGPKSLEMKPARLSTYPTDDAAKACSHVLARTLNALIYEPDFKTFLDQLLIALTKELRAHSAALWFQDESNGTTFLRATSYQGRVLTGEDQLGHPYAARRGQSKRNLIARAQAGGSALVEDVQSSSLIEPEVRDWMTAHGVRSLLCIPLESNRKIKGALIFRGAKRHTFAAREEQLGRLLAHHVSLAMHLMRLGEQAEESAVLAERTRIAQEMHDTLAQSLTAINLHLEVSKGGFESDADAALSHLRLAQELARESLLDTQRSIWALRPAALDGQDLAAALTQLVARRSDASTEVRFSLFGTPFQLPQDTEVNLLRICQEAVNNAVRHAKASKVRIELAHMADAVRLIIEDNGRALEPDRGEVETGSLGLPGIKERVGRIGGKLAIRSQPNFGTRIAVKVPIQQHQE